MTPGHWPQSKPMRSLPTLLNRKNQSKVLLAQLDTATGGALSKLAASGELTGKMLESTLLHYPQGLAAQRLLHPGRGEEGKIWHAGTAEARGSRRAITEIPAGEAPDVPGPRE